MNQLIVLIIFISTYSFSGVPFWWDPLGTYPTPTSTNVYGPEVAWFRLDDNSDNIIIHDSSSNKFDAVYRTFDGTYNTTLRSTNGVVDRALCFRTIEYGETSCPQLCSVLSSQSFTISFWGKRSFSNIHAEWFKASGPDTSMYCYYNKDYNNMLWHFYTPNSMLMEVTTSFPVDTWVHWTFSRNGTNFRMYRNGIMFSSATGTPYHTVTNFTFGGERHNYNTQRMVDDFRVYGYNLTSEEILRLYNSGAGTNGPLYIISN